MQTIKTSTYLIYNECNGCVCLLKGYEPSSSGKDHFRRKGKEKEQQVLKTVWNVKLSYNNKKTLSIY